MLYKKTEIFYNMNTNKLSIKSYYKKERNPNKKNK